MRVIIIKKCKEGNINDIVDVSSGYGTNFLIKNGFAEPINKSSQLNLEKRIKNNEEKFKENVIEATSLKKELEKITLIFELKTTNLIVHGSITTKKINQKLKELGFELNKHAIPHIQIESLGITNIKAKLFDKIEANIKVLVNKVE